MAQTISYVICAYRSWNLEAFKGNNLLSSKDTLSDDLAKLNPQWVFFLDWSWIISNSILNKYKCVCFHEADLPNFRGGSPIQNQIIRGIKKTKLTAFLMKEGIDKGDILLQEELSLEGGLNEIFQRVVGLTRKMIPRILNGDYTLRKQEGEGSYYERRKPFQSEFDELLFGMVPLEKIYDQIRMLEDPYPNAFLTIGERRIVFKSAVMENNKIKALAEII